MSEFKFKTNINCNNCIRSVSGFIEEVPHLEKWEVNTDHQDKILNVVGDGLSAEAVIEAVEDAGYDIEIIKE